MAIDVVYRTAHMILGAEDDPKRHDPSAITMSLYGPTPEPTA